MRDNLIKEVAQHCLKYVIPVCNQNYVDRISVFKEMMKQMTIEINVADASDPDRNR